MKHFTSSRCHSYCCVSFNYFLCSLVLFPETTTLFLFLVSEYWFQKSMYHFIFSRCYSFYYFLSLFHVYWFFSNTPRHLFVYIFIYFSCVSLCHQVKREWNASTSLLSLLLIHQQQASWMKSLASKYLAWSPAIKFK